MGPVESEVLSHMREVRQRLNGSKPQIILTDNTKELMLEVALLKNKLAAAEKEIERLRPSDKDERDNRIIDRVASIVAEREKIAKILILGRSRYHKAVLPRHICFYLLATGTVVSCAKAGRYFGKCDHTTVLYAREKIAAMRLASAEFDSKIREYESLV